MSRESRSLTLLPLPDSILAAIEEGPDLDERFNDEWKRREMFATRIARLAYAAGKARGSENAPSSKDADRWDLVRRWLTHDEELYIPGIHQARTVDAVNEAVDRALKKLRNEGPLP